MANVSHWFLQQPSCNITHSMVAWGKIRTTKVVELVVFRYEVQQEHEIREDKPLFVPQRGNLHLHDDSVTVSKPSYNVKGYNIIIYMGSLEGLVCLHACCILYSGSKVGYLIAITGQISQGRK